MKILFVFKSDFSTVPLGILALSGVLKNCGHECDFIDLKFDFNYIRKIQKIKPDILAYSIVSYTWKYYRDINLKIKEKVNAFSIFGGPHCSISPDFINNQGVDAICIGEGEFAFMDLAYKLDNNLDITSIENLWIKKDNKIYKNEVRPLLSDLNFFPFSDIELLTKYRFFRKIGIYFIMTSRGCPFKCPYCINHFYRKLYENKGQYIRRRSVESVLEELMIYKNKYKAKLIVFNDDIFTTDRVWLKEFADKYIENVALPFEAYIRIGTIDEPTIALLKKMGCVHVLFGIESGNHEIRKNILKRNVSNDEIIEVSNLLKKYKIKSIAFNMLALPKETLENAIETMELNAKCKIDNPMSFIFQPFPNLELTKYAIENDYYNEVDHNFYKGLVAGKVMMKSNDSKKIARLHSLFVIGSKLKLSASIIRFLVRLPINPLYKLFLGTSRAFIYLFIIYRPSLEAIIIFYLKLPFLRLLSFFK